MLNPEFHERLSMLVGDEKPFAWANRVGISKGAFTRIWNEGTMPKVEQLQKIKQFTGAKIGWMIDGEGFPPDYVLKIDSLRVEANNAFLTGDDEESDRLMLKIEEARSEYLTKTGQNESTENFTSNFALVPRHDVTVSGGHGAIISSEQIVDYFAFNKTWLRKHGLNEKQLVLVEVDGDSMSPILSSGDTVLVDTSQTDLKTGAAYVLRIGDELLVKYVQRLPGEKIQVFSENREVYPPFDIDLAQLNGDITIIGRVVNSSRNW